MTCDIGMVMNTAIAGLRVSRESLQDLDTRYARRFNEGECFLLVTDCPNLQSLKMKLSFDVLDWPASSSGQRRTSKLKVLDLNFEVHKVTPLDQSGEWVGEALEELSLTRVQFAEVSIFEPFRPFSSTLKMLRLFGSASLRRSSSPWWSESFYFKSLHTLRVEANIELVKFFLKHQSTSLQRIEINAFQGGPEAHYNHKDILRILKSCRESLTSVCLQEVRPLGIKTEGISELDKLEVLKTRLKSFSLPLLRRLSLSFLDSTFDKLYGSLEIPEILECE